MKKLSKLLLITLFFTMISPINVFAEPDTPPDKIVEAEKAEAEKAEAETETEGIKVDEDNESPFLYDEKEGNPDESKREKEIIKKPMETPASVTGEKYEGSGTVTDFTTTGGKAFYTVKGTDNKVFYIVIDMDKTEDNVYFMSEINGEELTLDEATSQTNTPIPTQEEKTENPIKEEKDIKETKSSSLVFWLILLVVSILFIAFHLFFGKLTNLNPLLNKNKNKNKQTPETVEDENQVYNQNDLPEKNKKQLVPDNQEEEK